MHDAIYSVHDAIYSVHERTVPFTRWHPRCTLAPLPTPHWPRTQRPLAALSLHPCTHFRPSTRTPAKLLKLKLKLTLIKLAISLR